jgi:hypothetical protein
MRYREAVCASNLVRHVRNGSVEPYSPNEHSHTRNNEWER